MATGIDLDGNVLKHNKVKEKLKKMLKSEELSFFFLQKNLKP